MPIMVTEREGRRILEIAGDGGLFEFGEGITLAGGATMEHCGRYWALVSREWNGADVISLLTDPGDHPQHILDTETGHQSWSWCGGTITVGRCSICGRVMHTKASTMRRTRAN